MNDISFRLIIYFINEDYGNELYFMAQKRLQRLHFWALHVLRLGCHWITATIFGLAGFYLKLTFDRVSDI